MSRRLRAGRGTSGLEAARLRGCARALHELRARLHLRPGVLARDIDRGPDG